MLSFKHFTPTIPPRPFQFDTIRAHSYFLSSALRSVLPAMASVTFIGVPARSVSGAVLASPTNTSRPSTSVKLLNSFFGSSLSRATVESSMSSQFAIPAGESLSAKRGVAQMAWGGTLSAVRLIVQGKHLEVGPKSTVSYLHVSNFRLIAYGGPKRLDAEARCWLQLSYE